MLRHAAVAVLLALGAAACQKGNATKAPSAEGGAAKGDLEARVAKLEKRMDKIISILEQAMPPNEPDPAVTYSVPVSANDPQIGPADAKITIVEGFEFACPFCWKASPTIEQLLVDYPKDVRVVDKYILIHGPPALPPGLAACAAQKQGKYAVMKKLLWSKLFNAAGEIQRDQLAPENLEKAATEAGLDVGKLKADMEGESCKAWVKESQETLSAVGTTGTPSFYINGRHLGGAMPIEDFKKVIQEELTKADKAISGGVKQSEYYAKVVVEKGEKKVKGRFED